MLQGAIQINPNSGASFHIGALLVERTDCEEAIEAFRAGLALMPESPQGHNNLGGALAASGRTAEATAEFEQALRLIRL
jgi:Tfp pilus assembly protein PilF